LRKEKVFNEGFELYIDNKKLNGFMDFFYKGIFYDDKRGSFLKLITYIQIKSK
jgi:hypothetical protein